LCVPHLQTAPTPNPYLNWYTWYTKRLTGHSVHDWQRQAYLRKELLYVRLHFSHMKIFPDHVSPGFTKTVMTSVVKTFLY